MTPALRRAQQRTLQAQIRDPGQAKRRIAESLGRHLTPAQMASLMDACMQVDPSLADTARDLADVISPDEYTVRVRASVRYDWTTVAFDGAGLFADPGPNFGWFIQPKGVNDPVTGRQKTQAQTNNDGQNGQLSSDTSFVFGLVKYGIRLAAPPATNNGAIVSDILQLVADNVGALLKVGSQSVDELGLPPLWNNISMGFRIASFGDITAAATDNSSSIVPTDCCPFVFGEHLEVGAGIKFQVPLELDIASLQAAGAQADFANAQIQLGCQFEGLSAVTVPG